MKPKTVKEIIKQNYKNQYEHYSKEIEAQAEAEITALTEEQLAEIENELRVLRKNYASQVKYTEQLEAKIRKLEGING